jgi:hypothetical protein
MSGLPCSASGGQPVETDLTDHAGDGFAVSAAILTSE